MDIYVLVLYSLILGLHFKCVTYVSYFYVLFSNGFGLR